MHTPSFYDCARTRTCISLLMAKPVAYKSRLFSTPKAYWPITHLHMVLYKLLIVQPLYGCEPNDSMADLLIGFHFSILISKNRPVFLVVI